MIDIGTNNEHYYVLPGAITGIRIKPRGYVCVYLRGMDNYQVVVEDNRAALTYARAVMKLKTDHKNGDKK